MSTLKIALVGCGKIADGHIEEIQKLGALAQVVAVCDRELLMAEQVAVRYGIPHHFDCFEELLAQTRPDVVHITTPPQSHLPLAKTALEAGCHVYVEKPLTLSYADSQALLELVEKAGKKLTIGYSYYFDPPARELQVLLEKGALGEVLHVESFFGYNLAGQFGTAILSDGDHWVHRLPGKLFQNNIDHLLYKAIPFLDTDTPRVQAISSVLRPQRFGDSRDQMGDELRLMIQGERVSIFGTFSSHIRPVGNFLRVYGTKGTAHVDYTMRTVVLEPSSTLPSALGRLVPAFQMARAYYQAGRRNIRRFRNYDFHYFSGMNYLIQQFYRCIIDDTPPPIPYREILRGSAIMDTIFEQLRAEETR